MLIHKCDKCGTEIEGTSLQIGFDIAYGIALCRPCATPVIHFLKRSQLLEVQLARHGFIKDSTPRAKLKPTSLPPALSDSLAGTSLDQTVSPK